MVAQEKDTEIEIIKLNDTSGELRRLLIIQDLLRAHNSSLDVKSLIRYAKEIENYITGKGN